MIVLPLSVDRKVYRPRAPLLRGLEPAVQSFGDDVCGALLRWVYSAVGLLEDA